MKIKNTQGFGSGELRERWQRGGGEKLACNMTDMTVAVCSREI